MSDPKGVAIETQEHFIHATLGSEATDSDSLTAIKEQLCGADAAPSELPVLLDLTEVKLLPSMSLGDLLQIKKGLAAQKRRLLLVGVVADVRRTFAITHLDKLFEMHDTVEEALAHLQAPR